MLSIIICSVNPRYLHAVSHNIQDTVGIEYELLTFDNRLNNYGICKVYNQQARMAKYPYLLFLHEDIIIKTKNWGKLLLQIFENNRNCGMVGVAGSNYKSKMFSGWYTSIPELDAFHILHHHNGTEVEMLHHRPVKANLYEAVCLDGVFMATTHSLWQQIKFNEEKLVGFHYYDIDFSLRTSFKKTIYVTMDIAINHITTGGDFGDKWVEQTFLFHDYFGKFLPWPRPEKDNRKVELHIATVWLDRLKTSKISLVNKINWIGKQHLFRYPQLYYGISKFLFYQPFGLRNLHRFLKKKSSYSDNADP